MRLRRVANRLLGPAEFDEIGLLRKALADTTGVMIDVGAHEGFSAEPFLAHGWTVYAFEPDPKNRQLLEKRCPTAVIDPRAVSDVNGKMVELFTSDISTGISTLSPFHATHAATATVSTIRLDTYIADNGVLNVDFLKTDIEGLDLVALQTFPWESHHPKAVICEFEDHKTKRLGHTYKEIAQFLISQGYAVIVSEWDPIVEYGGQHQWRRLVRYPVELSEDSWGNLIAVNPTLMNAIEKLGRANTRRLRVRRWVDRFLT